MSGIPAESSALSRHDETIEIPQPTRGLSVYLELTKAKLCMLVLITTLVGFLLGTPTLDLVLLTWTLLGTAMAAFGANALNQCVEVSRDARMHRTQGRPLPSRRLTPVRAYAVSVTLAVAGPLILFLLVNPLAAFLALLTEVLYLFAYTPLKTRTTLNTLVGAVVGAIPPMIGWAAARGDLALEAWLLAVLLFVWQIPHFLSLAWLYREDYARGGFRMLPIIDPEGSLTGRMVMLYALFLVPISLAFTLVGSAGVWYAIAALILGLGMLAAAVRFSISRAHRDARVAFLASVLYLPLVLFVLVANRETAMALF